MFLIIILVLIIINIILIDILAYFAFKYFRSTFDLSNVLDDFNDFGSFK